MGTEEDPVNSKPTRKPFVAPVLKEEATLTGVTLVSGGSGSPTAMVRRTPSSRNA
jgi:hypothetical protein